MHFKNRYTKDHPDPRVVFFCINERSMLLQSPEVPFLLCGIESVATGINYPYPPMDNGKKER